MHHLLNSTEYIVERAIYLGKILPRSNSWDRLLKRSQVGEKCLSVSREKPLQTRVVCTYKNRSTQLMIKTELEKTIFFLDNNGKHGKSLVSMNGFISFYCLVTGKEKVHNTEAK